MKNDKLHGMACKWTLKVVAPLQRVQAELADKRASGSGPWVVTGEESELQPIEYSVDPGLELPLEVEVRPAADT